MFITFSPFSVRFSTLFFMSDSYSWFYNSPQRCIHLSTVMKVSSSLLYVVHKLPTYLPTYLLSFYVPIHYPYIPSCSHCAQFSIHPVFSQPSVQKSSFLKNCAPTLTCKLVAPAIFSAPCSTSYHHVRVRTWIRLVNSKYHPPLFVSNSFCVLLIHFFPTINLPLLFQKNKCCRSFRKVYTWHLLRVYL